MRPVPRRPSCGPSAGPATVLRDGRAFEGTWSRPSPEDGTQFTTGSGQPLPLAEGPVWVLLVPR